MSHEFEPHLHKQHLLRPLMIAPTVMLHTASVTASVGLLRRLDLQCVSVEPLTKVMVALTQERGYSTLSHAQVPERLPGVA